MLFWSELLEQDIVLGTNAHHLAHFGLLSKQIMVKNGSATFRLHEQAGQDSDSRRLSSTILPEQSKYLA
jgi:hypothetical protein